MMFLCAAPHLMRGLLDSLEEGPASSAEAAQRMSIPTPVLYALIGILRDC